MPRADKAGLLTVDGNILEHAGHSKHSQYVRWELRPTHKLGAVIKLDF